MPPSARIRRDRSVVLVGRPNVGKSTLFNRVCGSRRAIVTPVAGTTRDVIRARAEWLGTTFELVDTGGLFGASSDPLRQSVSERGLAALDGADLVVLLVDGRDGLTPADRESKFSLSGNETACAHAYKVPVRMPHQVGGAMGVTAVKRGF